MTTVSNIVMRAPAALIPLRFLLIICLSLAVVIAHGDHDDKVDVLCRRCGATITQLNLALPAEEAPPDNGKSDALVDNDFDETGNRKLLKFRNKVGQTFDVALFKSAHVNAVAQTRSVQDSFFPGFAWRIAECSTCGAFLGWAYDRPGHCPNHHSHEKPEQPAKGTVSAEDAGPATDPEAVLDALFQSNCLQKALVYWHVEWCHKRSIKQFHIAGATMRRDPEYSLGEYSLEKGSRIVDSNLNMLIPGTIGVRKMIEHVFTDGQRCDETKQPRSTIVSVTCCTNYHQSLGPLNRPFIASLREPEICKYEMLICVPDLCLIPGFAPPASSKTNTAASSQTFPPGGAISDELVCASGRPPRGSPTFFLGFDWSTLVTDKSQDMFWTQTLHPVIGTGQLVL